MVDKRVKTGVDEPPVPKIAWEMVFKRLSAKDVGHCRGVCKEWYSFLSTREFTRMHLQNYQVTVDDYKLFAVDESQPASFPFRTLSFNQTLPPFNHDLNPNPKPNPGDVSIIASLDGLVCLLLSSSYRLMLLNPLTDSCKELSPIPRCYGGGLAAARIIGFYFDSCNDDYKLLCLLLGGDGPLVYSLNLDSWTDIDFPFHQLLRCFWSPATFCGQYLYFEVSCFGDDDAADLHFYSRIIRFDVKTETFSEIQVPLPTADGASRYFFAGLVVLKGCLHLYVSYDITSDAHGADVWMLKDDDEWEKVRSFTGPQQLQQQKKMQLICTQTTGDWLAVLDQHENSFKKMTTEEFETHYRCFTCAPRTYRFGRVIYVPTLVDP